MSMAHSTTKSLYRGDVNADLEHLIDSLQSNNLIGRRSTKVKKVKSNLKSKSQHRSDSENENDELCRISRSKRTKETDHISHSDIIFPKKQPRILIDDVIKSPEYYKHDAVTKLRKSLHIPDTLQASLNGNGTRSDRISRNRIPNYDIVRNVNDVLDELYSNSPPTSSKQILNAEKNLTKGGRPVSTFWTKMRTESANSSAQSGDNKTAEFTAETPKNKLRTRKCVQQPSKNKVTNENETAMECDSVVESLKGTDAGLDGGYWGGAVVTPGVTRVRRKVETLGIQRPQPRLRRPQPPVTVETRLDSSTSNTDSESNIDNDEDKSASDSESISSASDDEIASSSLKLNKKVVVRRGKPKKTSIQPLKRLKHKGDSLPDQVNSYNDARIMLQGSTEIEWLPCREKESLEVYQLVKTQISTETSGCVYISGVPGTGKTAVVNLVLEHLQVEMNDKNGSKPFQLVCINGMQLSDPHQVYQSIYYELTQERGGARISSHTAVQRLQKYFIEGLQIGSGSKGKTTTSKRLHTVLLLDEMDQLWTRKQSVLYELFDWPTKAADPGLSVIAIANMLDLPERCFVHRVSSRLGMQRLSFQPYSFNQIEEILKNRLDGALEGFDAPALQLLSRKVAAVSGDIRRALEICKRALEISEAELEVTKKGGSSRKSTKGKLGKAVQIKPRLTMEHVQNAIKEMQTHPLYLAVKNASKHQIYILRAILGEVMNTGKRQVEFSILKDNYDRLARMDAKCPLGEDCLKLSVINPLCDLCIISAVNNGSYAFQLIMPSHDLSFALQ